MKFRVFYAAGPGNIIQAHKFWASGEHYPNEVSVTFSSQFEECCTDLGVEAYIVSSFREKAIYRDGAFTLEHRPKPMPDAKGLRYHVAESLYGIGLFLTAVRIRADAAILDSGSSHYFIFSLFRLAGIATIVVLHNTLWPTGFPPLSRVSRMIAKLNSHFFRWIPIATIGVSPECIRQVHLLTKGRHKQLYQIRAQFRRDYFQNIPPPLSHHQRPFQVTYVGRITRDKGVFDVLEMAKKLHVQLPGQIRWELCGSGPDLEELRRVQNEMGLSEVVSIRGWTSPQELKAVHERSHISIVPTRSTFCEGLTLAAAEGILAGRPVIISPVNPALEVLKAACVEAKTNDVDSYVDGILKVLNDPSYYEALCNACLSLQEQFYDRSRGLSAVIREILGTQPNKIISRSK